MSSYTIQVQGGPSFRCTDCQPILLAALQQGVMLPFACGFGGCDQCRARLLSGRIDLSRQRLSPTTNESGFGGTTTQLCQAFPLSDCTILMA